MTTHVKDTPLPNTSGTNTFTASVTSTGGNLLVLGFTAWMTGNNPVNISNITDSAGNTWHFSTSTSQNPPANGSYATAETQYGLTCIAWCIGASAITSITVTTSASVTSFGEGAVSEFSSLPAGAVVLGAASSGALATFVTSYTTPTVTVASPSPVLVVIYTSNFGQFTGVTSGYTILSVSDAIAAYNTAVTAGSISATLTQSGADVPSSAILVIGAPASATVAGVTATSTLAAPVGSVHAGAMVSGAVGTSALAAPTGTVKAGAALAGVVASTALAAPAGFARAPATFYVSPSGSDSSNGTSTATAWQTIAKVNSSQASFIPGDTILFQGGQTFSGTMLFVTQGGSAAFPITYGSYGTGQAVLSNGTNNAVFVSNVGGVSVQNLTATGISGSTGFNGIQFFCSGTGRLPAISVVNCSSSGWEIGVSIGGSAAADGWNGITVSGCTTSGNVFYGIQVFGTTATSYNHQNLTIGNCTANGNTGLAANTTAATGFGITVGGVSGGTISGCTASGNGANNGNTAGGPVGIMVYNSTGVTISGCLAYSNTSGTGADGDGIDLDIGCVGCTVEYCLAYSNKGAGILLFGGSSVWSGNVARYNMCWGNSTGYAGYGELVLNGNAASTDIYGNTLVGQNNGSFYGIPFLATNNTTISGVGVWNNVFYAPATTSPIARSDAALTSSQLILQGNCYYTPGTLAVYWGASYSTLAAWQAAAANQEKVGGSSVFVSANPLLVTPGSAPTVTTPAILTGAAGLELQGASPCIGTGLNLQSVFGVNPGSRDFFGNALTTPLSIGASQPVNIAGAVATTSLAAPGGSVSAGAAVSGALAISSLASPSGSVIAGARISGAVGTTALAAPTGSARVAATVAGAVATSVLASPAGSAAAGATVAGVAAISALLAPLGSAAAGASATVSGVPATSALASFAGSLLAGAQVPGVVANSSLAAVAGAATAGAMVAGVASTGTLTSPAGAAVAGGSVSGAAGVSALAAPAGSPRAGAMVTGAVGAAALAAPAGAVTVPGTIPGVTASLASAAPAGVASAGADIPGAVASLALATAAGAASSFKVILTLSVGVECNVMVGLTVTATMSVNVGAPYQGTIASLATDRWYSMAPS